MPVRAANESMTAKSAPLGVIFVCMGNICRSPTAEGVFRHLAERAGLAQRLHIDSAGTHAYHIGEAPDLRSQKAARARGYDLSVQRARRFEREDFERFHFILAMDRDNLAALQRIRPRDFGGHLGLFLDFAPETGFREVPDPYYDGARGFEDVLDMIETASERLLAAILAAEQGGPGR